MPLYDGEVSFLSDFDFKWETLSAEEDGLTLAFMVSQFLVLGASMGLIHTTNVADPTQCTTVA